MGNLGYISLMPMLIRFGIARGVFISTLQRALIFIFLFLALFFARNSFLVKLFLFLSKDFRGAAEETSDLVVSRKKGKEDRGA